MTPVAAAQHEGLEAFFPDMGARTIAWRLLALVILLGLWLGSAAHFASVLPVGRSLLWGFVQVAPGLLPCAIWFLRRWRSPASLARLRVTPVQLWYVASWDERARWSMLLRRSRRIEAAEVAGLEWDGSDNLGIRLHDGEVRSVPLRSIVARDRERARAAVLRFVKAASQTR